MIHVQGRFYYMNYNPFSFLAYDIAANNWWRIQALMRRFLWSPSLVESRGRLILVATVEKSKLNVPKKLEDLGSWRARCHYDLSGSGGNNSSSGVGCELHDFAYEPRFATLVTTFLD
ncbi:hypothetical protein AAG906_035570 [Vitis piasezkii]